MHTLNIFKEVTQALDCLASSYQIDMISVLPASCPYIEPELHEFWRHDMFILFVNCYTDDDVRFFRSHAEHPHWIKTEGDTIKCSIWTISLVWFADDAATPVALAQKMAVTPAEERYEISWCWTNASGSWRPRRGNVPGSARLSLKKRTTVLVLGFGRWRSIDLIRSMVLIAKNQ